jgi:membrane-associated phospholipid phosphatase
VLIWLGSGVVLITLCVLFVDRAVSTWSHAVLHSPLLAVDITLLAGWRYPSAASFFVLVAALVARITGRELGPIWRAAIAAAVATLFATLAVTFVKYGFGREWPETWVRNTPNPSWISNHAYGFTPFHGGEGYLSCPSGHTTRMAAPGAVLWRRLPRLRVLWVLPAVIVAVALVAADFHFVGDCVAGVYLGVACAALVMMVL